MINEAQLLHYHICSIWPPRMRAVSLDRMLLMQHAVVLVELKPGAVSFSASRAKYEEWARSSSQKWTKGKIQRENPSLLWTRERFSESDVVSVWNYSIVQSGVGVSKVCLVSIHSPREAIQLPECHWCVAVLILTSRSRKARDTFQWMSHYCGFRRRFTSLNSTKLATKGGYSGSFLSDVKCLFIVEHQFGSKSSASWLKERRLLSSLIVLSTCKSSWRSSSWGGSWPSALNIPMFDLVLLWQPVFFWTLCTCARVSVYVRVC